MSSWREPLSHLRSMVRESRTKGELGWSLNEIEARLDILNDIHAKDELEVLDDVDDSDIEKKKKDSIEKVTATLYDKASAYTTLILGVGYTGYFTLWDSFSEKMPDQLRAVSGALMIFSLSVFIFWEVFKMLLASKQSHRYAQLLLRSGDDYIQEEREVVEWESRVNRGLYKSWIYIQLATILPALPALLILLYTHVSLL